MANDSVEKLAEMIAAHWREPEKLAEAVRAAIDEQIDSERVKHLHFCHNLDPQWGDTGTQLAILRNKVEALEKRLDRSNPMCPRCHGTGVIRKNPEFSGVGKAIPCDMCQEAKNKEGQ